MAILIAFIIILLCVTSSKFRSLSRVRKESQEEPMETLIKITESTHGDIDKNYFIIGKGKS